jgi:hypothetical protein
MAEFRYYCLHGDGKIAVGEHVEAADLNAAIEHAYAVARAHPTGAFRYVEVWPGAAIFQSALTRAAEPILPSAMWCPSGVPSVRARGSGGF